MSYRVETALTGRAGCKATECKKAGIKIEKDDLRMGVWVNYDDGGSWAWKHWGCVSGQQLQNIRNHLEDPANPGVYRWDYLDGYEGDEKNSLEKHPDLQEKVRRVVTQGFIDEEDWNGDPEMNKLGEMGIRTMESKKQGRIKAKEAKRELAELGESLRTMRSELEEQKQAGRSTSKLESVISNLEKVIEVKTNGEEPPRIAKRARPASFEGADDEKPKPAKKLRTKKPVKQEDEDTETDEKKATPTKKGRGKKVVKQEADETEDEEQRKPTKKGRGKKLLKQEEDETEDEEVMPAPSRRAAASRRIQKGEELKEENDGEALVPVVTKRPRGKRPAKEEPDVKAEPVSGSDDPAEVPKKPARGRKATKKEEEVKHEDEANDHVQIVAKEARGNKNIKKEEADKEEEAISSTRDAVAGPSKRTSGRKAVKKQEAVKDEQHSDVELAVPAPKKRARGKKAVKQEIDAEDVTAVKDELVKSESKDILKSEMVGDPGEIEDDSQPKQENTSSSAVKGESSEARGGLIAIPEIKTQTNGGLSEGIKHASDSDVKDANIIAVEPKRRSKRVKSQ